MKYLFLLYLLAYGCGGDSGPKTVYRKETLRCSYGHCSNDRVFCKNSYGNTVNCEITTEVNCNENKNDK
jgi:hypothetical protein